MNRLIYLAFCTLLLSGCAMNSVWVHPTKSENEFYADQMECQEYANRNSQQGKTTQMQVAGNPYNDAFASGWNQGAAVGDSIANSSRRNQMETICMKSKGWRLESRE